MPVSEIRPGMKGYGLTVFEGTEPSRFEVEVIDVLSNFRPRQDLILVKTKHPRLEVAKVVAGMSGSPVYLNGKMIGAYAYGWTFGEEPVAGVTPIQNMVEELVRPLPDFINGWPLGSKRAAKPRSSSRRVDASATSYRGEPGRYHVREHSAQLALRQSNRPEGGPTLARASTPLLMGGMTNSSVDLAQELFAGAGFEPLQAGGGSAAPDPNAPRRYVDGGAIGVEMIRGDMSAMGLGTVTRVEGDRLVAFGHPMMQAGVTALPTAVGRVVWFLASKMRSFKIGMPVRSVGALVNDRTASIVVSHSAEAPVIPVSLKIRGIAGMEESQWDFELAHEKFMAPSFLAVAVGNALQAIAAERQDVSWSARSTIEVRGHGKLVIDDYGVAVGGTPDAQQFVDSNLVGAVGSLMNNPWEPLFIERASTTIELVYARNILRLKGAEVLEPEVDAGSSARIRLTLLPFDGPEITRVVELPIPAHLAGRELSVTITPGYMEARDVATPDNVDELIRNLQDPTYPPQSAVFSYSAGDGAVAFKGLVATDLPPGALDMLAPTSNSLAPRTFGAEVRYVTHLPAYMIGQQKVSLKVKAILR